VEFGGITVSHQVFRKAEKLMVTNFFAISKWHNVRGYQIQNNFKKIKYEFFSKNLFGKKK
jgi:hypothetical protein